MTDQREQQLNETEDAGRVRQSAQDDTSEPNTERPRQSAHESIQDSAISCLLIIAGLLHARVSPGQVEQLTRFSAHPLDMAGLVHLARKVGLRAKPRKIDHKHTSSITSPVIAQCNDGSFFVLARVEQSPQGQAHALVLFPQERSARRVTIDELWSFFTGSIVVLSDKSMMSGDVSFGFRWFLQSVLKFKEDFVCVFLAAFVIQLIGILTPLIDTGRGGQGAGASRGVRVGDAQHRHADRVCFRAGSWHCEKLCILAHDESYRCHHQLAVVPSSVRATVALFRIT